MSQGLRGAGEGTPITSFLDLYSTSHNVAPKTGQGNIRKLLVLYLTCSKTFLLSLSRTGAFIADTKDYKTVSSGPNAA